MTAFGTTKRKVPFLLVPAAALLFAISACDMAENGQGDAAESAEQRNWKLIQAYNDLDAAWHARDREISQSDASSEEKDRQRTEERGEHPDIVLPVVAARELAAGDSERAFDAAKFLVQSTQDLSPTDVSDKEFGNAAMLRIVGPDWSVVETYNSELEAWKQDDEARREEFKAQEEGSGKPFIFVQRPESLRAEAAAQAILETGPDHEKAGEAAEFLVDQPRPNPRAMLNGARALARNMPDFDTWPDVLMKMDFARTPRDSEAFDEFLAEMASNSSDPVVRATARYFGAKGLVEGVNQPSMDPADRNSRREQALELATGLSAGVETEEFVRKWQVDGEEVTRTLADVEAALVHGIRHTVVGATVADEAGMRLDGTQENLSAYAGTVVLMDFWATWCGPCKAALPQMRELDEGYSEDRFNILGLSVDDELETVTDFLEDESMPWAHWHIGVGSDLQLAWDIPGYPTYVVIGQDGEILSRGHNLDTAAEAIELALNGEA